MAFDDNITDMIRNELWGSWITDGNDEPTNQLNTRFDGEGALLVEVMAEDRMTRLETWRVDLVQVPNRGA